MIDHLNARLPSVGIACLYSDYRDQTKQTLVNILGSLLHQFLTSDALLHIPPEVVEVLENIRKKHESLAAQDAIHMLKLTLQQLVGSFICIDALDELELNTRRQLLEKLKEMTTHTTHLRLFLTGRKHIQPEVHKQFEVRSEYEVEIVASPDDVQKYLREEIAQDAIPDAINEPLENEILTTLVERSQGMYVSQNLTELCCECIN